VPPVSKVKGIVPQDTAAAKCVIGSGFLRVHFRILDKLG
jgi:hypothetical protein